TLLRRGRLRSGLLGSGRSRRHGREADQAVFLRRFSVTDFRSWPEAELELDPGVTVLVGSNGVGKTNLVEGIGYLASLGSHRVSSDVPLIRRGAEQAVLRGEVHHH